MKKIFALLLAVAITAPVFMSCGKNAVSVKTQSDSINYALGAANAGGIRQYVLMADTADITKVNEFCKGIENSLKKQTPSERLAIEGYRMGVSMKKEIETGFLFNDSTIPAKTDLIISSFKAQLNREECFTNAEEGMQYFQNIMGASMQTGESANLTPEQADTINMLLGIINGNGARKFILGADTAKKDIKVFVSEFEKGLNNASDNELYVKGLEIGSTLNQQFSRSEYLFNDSTIELKLDIIKVALLDNLKKEANVLMNAEDATEWLNKTMEAKEAEKNKGLAAEGEAFLAENAKREGVFVTESGLQYEVVTMGEGEKPTAESTVKVHYHGTLIDGTVFDENHSEEGIEFVANRVIRGWTEGLGLVGEGGKLTLYIPSELAYGERGNQAIAPNSVLIFDVEVLKVGKYAPEAR